MEFDWYAYRLSHSSSRALGVWDPEDSGSILRRPLHMNEHQKSKQINEGEIGLN